MQVFFLVVGEKDDLPPRIGKIEEDAGVIRHEAVRGVQKRVRLIPAVKRADVAEAVERDAGGNVVVHLRKDHGVVIEPAVQLEEHLLDVGALRRIVFLVQGAAPGRHIDNDLFIRASDLRTHARTALHVEEGAVARVRPEDILPLEHIVEHIVPLHHLKGKAVRVQQVVRHQHVALGVAELVRRADDAPAHLLQRRAVPCIQVDLALLFDEEGSERRVVDDIPAGREQLAVLPRVDAHRRHPVAAQPADRILHAGQVVFGGRNVDLQMRIGRVCAQLAQDVKRIAQNALTVIGLQQDGVRVDLPFFIPAHIMVARTKERAFPRTLQRFAQRLHAFGNLCDMFIHSTIASTTLFAASPSSSGQNCARKALTLSSAPYRALRHTAAASASSSRTISPGSRSGSR